MLTYKHARKAAKLESSYGQGPRVPIPREINRSTNRGINTKSLSHKADALVTETKEKTDTKLDADIDKK